MVPCFLACPVCRWEAVCWAPWLLIWDILHAIDNQRGLGLGHGNALNADCALPFLTFLCSSAVPHSMDPPCHGPVPPNVMLHQNISASPSSLSGPSPKILE